MDSSLQALGAGRRSRRPALPRPEGWSAGRPRLQSSELSPITAEFFVGPRRVLRPQPLQGPLVEQGTGGAVGLREAAGVRGHLPRLFGAIRSAAPGRRREGRC